MPATPSDTSQATRDARVLVLLVPASAMVRTGPRLRWQRELLRGSDRQSGIRARPLKDTYRHARRPATEGKVEVR